MALETKKVDLVSSEYRAIGTGVTSLVAKSPEGKGMRVVAIAAGGAAPDADTVDRITAGDEFSYNGVNADIYAIGTTESFHVEVIRS